MVMASCATFSGTGCQDWAINVKNTFINFDATTLALPRRRSRSSSCPPPSRAAACAEDVYWEEATRELCHAMALRRDDVASISPGGSVGQVSAAQASGGKKTVERLDSSISEVSTTAGSPRRPRADSPNSSVGSSTPSQESLQTWTSVSSRKKPNQRLHNQTLAHVREDRDAETHHHPVTPSTPSAPAAAATPAWSTTALTPASKPKAWGGSAREEAAAATPAATPARKYDGKSKGLSHFQRIEVGIEDDRDFRVVQRLIGPKGKHMQEVTTQAKGAKVWIIGRGSRSWEDDVGPLVVCVGASSRPTLDVALGLINGLLAKVREEYESFYSS